MATNIIFLGTSGDSFVTGKQLRASGGIILKSEDLQLHIDPGPGAVIKSIQNGINLRANTAVLVSHAHNNHCNDVNAVVDAMTYGGFDKRGVLIANQTLVNGDEDIKPYLTEFHKKCLEKLIILKPGQKVGVEDIEIHALFAEHNDKHAIGFKFFLPDFVLSYSSDTKYSKELIKAYEGSDILILNVVAPGEEKIDFQLNTDDAVKIISKVKPKLAILTHFGMKMLKADPLYEAREIFKQTGIQVIAAKDGMIISPSSYSAQSRQKRLNLFEVKEEPVEFKKNEDVETGISESSEEVKEEKQEEKSEQTELSSNQI